MKEGNGRKGRGTQEEGREKKAEERREGKSVKWMDSAFCMPPLLPLPVSACHLHPRPLCDCLPNSDFAILSLQGVALL